MKQTVALDSSPFVLRDSSVLLLVLLDQPQKTNFPSKMHQKWCILTLIHKDCFQVSKWQCSKPVVPNLLSLRIYCAPWNQEIFFKKKELLHILNDNSSVPHVGNHWCRQFVKIDVATELKTWAKIWVWFSTAFINFQRW